MSATLATVQKTTPLRWVTRAIGTLTAVAGIGLMAAGQGLAITGTGTITITSVYFDTTITDHQEGIKYTSWTPGASGPQLATFTDSTACPTSITCQPGTDFRSTILWGDGTTATMCAAPFAADCSISAPTFVSGTTGSYDITATHAFVDEKNGGTTGGFTVRVLVKDVADGEGPVTADNSANTGIAVVDQCLGFPDGVCSPTTQPSMSFSAVSGTAFTNKQIGSFQDANQLAVSTDGTIASPEYSVGIVWGDGTTGTGTFAIDTINCGTTPGLTAGSGCPVNLFGSHTYTTSGTKNVVITVGDGLDKRALTVNSTAMVAASGPACTAAGLTSDKPSPQQSGTIITFTGSSSTCGNPEYLFYVQATGLGGPWILGRGYGSAIWAWNTAGNGVTSYTVDVWVREIGSGVAQQSFFLLPYTLSTPLACTAANLTSDKASPQPSGTTVTFTASSSTCSQPQYLFYVQATGLGGPWLLARGYGSATYVWITTGDGKTTYTWDVWVRQNGSKVAQQTFKTISYTLS